MLLFKQTGHNFKADLLQFVWLKKKFLVVMVDVAVEAFEVAFVDEVTVDVVAVLVEAEEEEDMVIGVVNGIMAHVVETLGTNTVEVDVVLMATTFPLVQGGVLLLVRLGEPNSFLVNNNRQPNLGTANNRPTDKLQVPRLRTHHKQQQLPTVRQEQLLTHHNRLACRMELQERVLTHPSHLVLSPSRLLTRKPQLRGTHLRQHNSITLPWLLLKQLMAKVLLEWPLATLTDNLQSLQNKREFYNNVRVVLLFLSQDRKSVV